MYIYTMCICVYTYADRYSISHVYIHVYIYQNICGIQHNYICIYRKSKREGESGGLRGLQDLAELHADLLEAAGLQAPLHDLPGAVEPRNSLYTRALRRLMIDIRHDFIYRRNTTILETMVMLYI